MNITSSLKYPINHLNMNTMHHLFQRFNLFTRTPQQ